MMRIAVTNMSCVLRYELPFEEQSIGTSYHKTIRPFKKYPGLSIIIDFPKFDTGGIF